MRIITVARKPCTSSGTTTNVVEHEAGAININRCRIGSGDGDTRDKEGSQQHRHTDSGATSFATAPEPRGGDMKGRWPTNVIFVHCPSCKIVGERKVSTGTAHREKSGGRTIFSEIDKKALPNMSYADEKGMETVPQWECEPGCAVAELDRQSGQLTSGTGAVKRSSSKDRQGNRSTAYGAESRPEGTPIPTYGDTGGASRFYKCFKAPLGGEST